MHVLVVNTSTSKSHSGGECEHTFNDCPIELGQDSLVDSERLQLAEKEDALLGFLCDDFSIDVPF